MNHLIVSREYPPCNYPQGGIGTYVAHVARLLAEHGETVHVIGERWKGAPLDREEQCDGRLIVHRVAIETPLPGVSDAAVDRDVLDALRRSDFPPQAFAWQVARLAESLVEREGIDCIEAQEFEAPLYFFLLRRALGLGPHRQPPCFVHLHSPMQCICRHNDWDIGDPGLLKMKRLEDYVILASDAALCPSHFLGRQAERHYGLPDGSIVRIPLPRGDTAWIDRTAETWESGAIAYVGRMELRKGVFEWMDAAVIVARERPGVRFELIGSDIPLTGGGGQSVREALARRIPRELQASITLLDAISRPRLFERLARARLAVVPSRWENFPNTCVEAMATGLPVLASREGGMAEMLEEGRTGWFSRSVAPEDLADALRRALDTPADAKAMMGKAAAEAIRRLCDNTETISQHIEFRRALVERGPSRSRRVPPQDSSMVWSPDRRLDTAQPPRSAPRANANVVRASEASGLSIVIARGLEGELDRCRASIDAQTVAPLAVVLDGPQAIVNLLASAPRPRGVVLLDAGCRLESSFIERLDAALAADDSIGVMAPWQRRGRNAVPVTGFSPRRPYQWVQDDVGRCAVFRTVALEAVAWAFDISGGVLRPGDVALAVLLEGWTGSSYPYPLVSCSDTRDLMAEALASTGRVALFSLLRARFPGEVAMDAQDVLSLARTEADTSMRSPSPGEILRMPMREKVNLAKRALGDPAGAVRWLVDHSIGALGSGAHRSTRSADKA